MPKSRARRHSLNSQEQPSSTTGTAATSLVSQISSSINDYLQRDGVVPEGATRFKRNMILLAHCRDVCALDVGNADGYDVRSRPLMAIREWTKDGRGAEMIKALDFDINSSAIASLFGYRRIFKRFCSNEDGIAVGQNVDTRVWDTFKATNVEYAAISCRLMSKSPGKSNELFNTIVPTTLHLICFFWALQILSRRAERYQADRKRGRSSRTLKHSSVKPPYNKLRSYSQRVASVVQSILLCWDTLLEAIGFVNCEEGLLPYLHFNLEMVELVVVKNRSDGYAPASQRKTFRNLVRGITGQHLRAQSRSEDVDNILRSLAMMFVQDVRDLTNDDTLFHSSSIVWNESNRFEVPSDGSRSLRFASLPPTIVARFQLVVHQSSVVETDRICQRSSEDVIVEIAQEDNASEQEGDSISNPDTDPCTTSCECAEAWKRLKGYCETALFRVHCCTFESLLEEEERITHDSIDFSLAESSKLLLTEPPSLKSECISGSDGPVLSEERSKRFVECTKDMVEVGRHAIIFFSAMDFSRWDTFFKSCTDEDGRTPSFHVDEIPFLLLEYMDSERGQSTYGNIF